MAKSKVSQKDTPRQEAKLHKIQHGLRKVDRRLSELDLDRRINALDRQLCAKCLKKVRKAYESAENQRSEASA